MDDPDRWRQMARTEGRQPDSSDDPGVGAGLAEVDLAYWSHGDQFAGEGWRASGSSPGHIIEYAEPELTC